MIYSNKELVDIDNITVRALNNLRRAGIRTVAQIQELERDKFINDVRLTYLVRLEILNYLHKNRLYFFDDVVPSK